MEQVLKRKSRALYLREYRANNPDKFKSYYDNRLIRDIVSGSKEGASCRIYIKQCKATGKLFVANSKNKDQSFISYSVSNSYRTKIRNSSLTNKNCTVCSNKYVGYHSSLYCEPCGEQVTKLVRAKHRYNAKQKRRAKESVGVSINRKIVFESFGWICQHCGVNTYGVPRGQNLPNEATIDHIVPLAKGGLHNYGNVQLLCRACNVKKSDKITEGVRKSSILK